MLTSYVGRKKHNLLVSDLSVLSSFPDTIMSSCALYLIYANSPSVISQLIVLLL
jgi:hypothetical protein